MAIKRHSTQFTYTCKVFGTKLRQTCGHVYKLVGQKSFISRQQAALWQLICASYAKLPIVSYDQWLG